MSKSLIQTIQEETAMNPDEGTKSYLQGLEMRIMELKEFARLHDQIDKIKNQSLTHFILSLEDL